MAADAKHQSPSATQAGMETAMELGDGVADSEPAGALDQSFKALSQPKKDLNRTVRRKRAYRTVSV